LYHYVTNPKEIFAECASKWKDSDENPKRGLGNLAIAVKPKKDKVNKALELAAAPGPPKNK
jgi:hypothetical protein